MERSHLLGALTRYFDNVIGVCGTHGKTTVTSMITQILQDANLSPSAVIGGKLPLIGANGICGDSETLVCESCEYVDTFLKESPDIAVLLNLEMDHVDYFHSLEQIKESFAKYADKAHIVVAFGDDEEYGDNYDDPAYGPSEVIDHNAGLVFGEMAGGDVQKAVPAEELFEPEEEKAVEEVIAEEKAKSLRSMEHEIENLVMAAATKVVGEKITVENSQKLYDEFLTEMGEAK